MNIWFKKVIGYFFAALIVTGVTWKTGFPVLYIELYNIYVFAGFILYLLLDLPPIKQPIGKTGSFFLLIGTFILFSIFYTGIAVIFPQFDPKFEIEKINKPPLTVIEAGPELIAAGKEIFMEYKCFNCHKADHMGSSDRGPDFDIWQIGLKTVEELKEDIKNPRKTQAKGFEDNKSKKAMPTYYGEDISKQETTALLAFLGTLRNKEQMPVRGKVDNLIPWDEDPEIIALGKKVYEGELYEDLNCAVCHGEDGMPSMEEARDLRNPLSKSRYHDKVIKEWTDADWFKSISEGVPDTAMPSFLEDYPPKAIWLSIVYAKQFHKKPKNNNLPPPKPLEPLE